VELNAFDNPTGPPRSLTAYGVQQLWESLTRSGITDGIGFAEYNVSCASIAVARLIAGEWTQHMGTAVGLLKPVKHGPMGRFLIKLRIEGPLSEAFLLANSRRLFEILQRYQATVHQWRAGLLDKRDDRSA
jgi:hypothetical protein